MMLIIVTQLPHTIQSLAQVEELTWLVKISCPYQAGTKDNQVHRRLRKRYLQVCKDTQLIIARSVNIRIWSQRKEEKQG